MLPIPQNENKLSLLIVLEDDNVARIKEHDCAEIHWNQVQRMYPRMTPATIGIAYATPSEMVQIQAFIEKDDVKSAIKLLTVGFKYRPEAGDHDFGPVSIKGKTS